MIGANGDIPGYNSFAYCSNNPVVGYDPLGCEEALTYDFARYIREQSLKTNPFSQQQLERLVQYRNDFIAGIELAVQQYGVEAIDERYLKQYCFLTDRPTTCNAICLCIGFFDIGIAISHDQQGSDFLLLLACHSNCTFGGGMSSSTIQGGSRNDWVGISTYVSSDLVPGTLTVTNGIGQANNKAFVSQSLGLAYNVSDYSSALYFGTSLSIRLDP